MDGFKNAAIIGATGGIGREVSFKIASIGYSIILVARKEDRLIELLERIKKINTRCDIVVADITKESDVERIFNFIEDKYGYLDVLVNCAGKAATDSIHSIKLDLWDEIMNVNAKGAFLCSVKALNLMKRKGKGIIINISSIAAIETFPGWTLYGVSKFALRGLSLGLIHEAREAGVKITMITPGAIDTPLWDGISGNFDRKLMINPVAVAQAVEFILNVDESAHIEDIIIRPVCGSLQGDYHGT